MMAVEVSLIGLLIETAGEGRAGHWRVPMDVTAGGEQPKSMQD
jgi:hypothetical protein